MESKPTDRRKERKNGPGGKSTGAGGNDRDRAERKRMQNRISQKCVRERNQAHALQLEQLIKTIKEANAGISVNEPNTVPLSAYLNLVEENEKLKDALLRIRKKMLSFSSLVGTTANDEIYDYILKRDTNSCEAEEPRSPSRSPEQENTTSIPQEAPGRQEHGQVLDRLETSSSQDEVSQREGKNQTPPHPSLPFPNINWSSNMPLEDVQPIEVDDANSFLADVTTLFNEPTEDTRNQSEQASTASSALAPINLDTLDLSMAQDFSTPWKPTFGGPSHLAFSPDMIYGACMVYMSQANGPHMADNNEEKNQNLVVSLAAVALRLVASLSGLESPIYGLGSSAYMWRVLRWRFSPTLANLHAIPEPYRPSFLQRNTPDHPLTIDFIPWGHIRDQLILRSEECDIDMIMRDIINHTVFEVHHRRIAVSVLEFFQYKMMAQRGIKCQSMFSDYNPSWRYATVTPSLTPFDPNLTGQSHLLRELSFRVPSTSPSQIHGNKLFTPSHADRCLQWKLSKTFAQRYPMLDCSPGMY